MALIGFHVHRCLDCVHSKWFWSTGLTAAWTPDGRPDSHSMTKYRVPSLKRDWDLGLLRFLYTTLKRGWSTGLGIRAFRRALSGEGHEADMHLVDRLAAVSDIIKVLVIHGREDVVIPVDNSVELVERIHGARVSECTILLCALKIGYFEPVSSRRS